MNFEEFINKSVDMIGNQQYLHDNNVIIETFNSNTNNISKKKINPEDEYVKLNETDEASKNNGILTKVWGPPLWIGLHAITFGYPYKIDENNSEHIAKRNAYYQFFKVLGDVLPCKYCRQSYKVFFEELDINLFLKDRKGITKWLYLIHEKVNDKLSVPECDRIKYRDFTALYETYRAKCKPDNKEEELVKKANEEKGCVKPLDNTPKRAIVNVVKCSKGDVTRRNNALDNWLKSSDKNEYILLQKKWVYLAGLLFLTMIILFFYKMK